MRLCAAPIEIGAVERVFIALHANFVAIVDAGDARQGKQQGIGQAHKAAAVLIPLRRKAAAALPIAVFSLAAFARQGGDGALGVVGGDKVHQHMQRGRRVVFTDAHNGVRSAARAAAAQKIQHGVAEGVIHHCVQPFAQQVCAPCAIAEFGGGVFPHFAQQVFVLAVTFYGRADCLNEIVRQLVGHIQPEAAGPKAKPGVNDAAFPADELAVALVAFVYLRQRVEAPPRAVAARVRRGKIVPAAVGAFGGIVGAAHGVAALAVEIDGIGPCVAEHTV